MTIAAPLQNKNLHFYLDNAGGVNPLPVIRKYFIPEICDNVSFVNPYLRSSLTMNFGTENKFPEAPFLTSQFDIGWVFNPHFFLFRKTIGKLIYHVFGKYFHFF